MSAVESRERKIIGFLCNWCSYGGADTAGVARATQPTDLRIVRVPCSGRIDPLFILRALLNGADGVLVSGCHPGDCHYAEGNYYARRRLEIVKQFLPVLGIDPRRFEYTWVSASEGQRWQLAVNTFTEQIHALPPAVQFENAEEFLQIADMSLTALRPLGTGQKAALDELKKAIKAKLPELDFVIGWQQGYDALHSAPLFMRKEEDVDKLVWGPLNVQNLATYLTQFKGKKIGIVVKGCDSRSVVELMQEELIVREDITVFSVPCEGTLDLARISQEFGKYSKIDSVEYDDAGITVMADGKAKHFCMVDYAQGKCYNCTTPGAVMADERFGIPTPVTGTPVTPPELAMLDAMSLEERFAFWHSEMARCTRCYACRNACPLCVCRDYCVAESRDPHWLTQENTTTEKFFFQTIHAMHLAGRCTGCGECQRACPVGIPILALRQQLARAVAGTFDGYKAGMQSTATPPLLGFSVQEDNIHEKEWNA